MIKNFKNKQAILASLMFMLLYGVCFGSDLGLFDTDYASVDIYSGGTVPFEYIDFTATSDMDVATHMRIGTFENSGTGGLDQNTGVSYDHQLFVTDMNNDVAGVILGTPSPTSPVKITVTSHPYSVGDILYFTDVGGTIELNNTQFIVRTIVDVDTINLDNIDGTATDSSAFTAWTSGGKVGRVKTAIIQTPIYPTQSQGGTSAPVPSMYVPARIAVETSDRVVGTIQSSSSNDTSVEAQGRAIDLKDTVFADSLMDEYEITADNMSDIYGSPGVKWQITSITAQNTFGKPIAVKSLASFNNTSPNADEWIVRMRHHPNSETEEFKPWEQLITKSPSDSQRQVNIETELLLLWPQEYIKLTSASAISIGAGSPLADNDLVNGRISIINQTASQFFTATEIADAVWDKQTSENTEAGSFGKRVDDVPTAVENATENWNTLLTGGSFNLATSAGRRLRELTDVVTHTGTAQGSGVSTNQIQLDTAASTLDGAYDPAIVVIVEGEGAGQARGVAQYDGATRTATVDRDWKTLPNASSVFNIYASAGRDSVNEGLATGGTSTTITLNALASSNNTDYENQKIQIRSGTGADQVRRVSAYNGATKVATVSRAWETIPDTTTCYYMLPDACKEIQAINGTELTDKSGTNWLTFFDNADTLSTLTADQITFIKNYLEGDTSTDTTTTPWQDVVYIKGTSTELARKDLTTTAGANITSDASIIGNVTEP